LINECPHHAFPQELLNYFFYEGLTNECQSKVDIAAGGTIGNKTAEEMHRIYEKLSESTLQKGERQRSAQVFHRTMKKIEPIGSEAQQPWRNIREVAMEIRPGPCRICGSYQHNAETCDAVIGEYDSGNDICYLKDNDQQGQYTNALPIHQQLHLVEERETVTKTLEEMNAHIRTLVNLNTPLVKNLSRNFGELVRRMEIKEEQHQLQYTQ